MPRQRKVVSHDLAALYTREHLTLREIGARVGMSGAGVWNRLKQLGVTAQQGEWVRAICALCTSPIRVRRKRWRTNRRVFCSAEHYYASRENPEYFASRNGSRLARAIVSQHFALGPEHVVHHVDSNQAHNDLANLEVYASHADHMRRHHRSPAQPIWRGAHHGQ